MMDISELESHEDDLVTIPVDIDEKTVYITISRKDVCLEGVRLAHGRLVWGVPKTNAMDCYRYCISARCELS